MRLKKILGFMMVLALMCLAEEVDYQNLDPKYYRYIRFYGDTSDEAIAELIRNVDNGEDKSSLFLGIALGGMPSMQNNQIDPIYGAKLGYQSFLPSFFDRLSKPGILGNRIYIQYYTGNVSRGVFGREQFSNISLAYDVLLDLPIMARWDAGLICGIGVGNLVYGESAISRLSLLANIGFGTSFLKHHRLDFELKIIPTANFDYFSTLFSLGYNYVF